MEIMPKVHLVPDVIANPYLIFEPEGLTLIDTGLPGSQKKILNYLSERGYAAKDLTRIIITHSDMDHVGGLAPLKRASGARVYASAVEAEAIAKGVSSRPIRPGQWRRRILMAVLGRFFKPDPVSVDEILSDGQTINVLGGLQVLATPGHTPGHISLYSPSTGILFVGDSIVSRDSGLVGSLPANTWNQELAAASVKKQAALGARVVCSGHGPVVQDAVHKMPVT
jgi:glyoxylase-like metal-dependent hydrolase (beta-lactamase superfamily II)